MTNTNINSKATQYKNYSFNAKGINKIKIAYASWKVGHL